MASYSVDADECVGGGSWGEVFKHWCSTTGSLIAVKRMKRQTTGNPERHLQLLQSEIAALQAVSGHPHVTTFMNWWADDQHVYVAMQLAEGGDLFGTLAKCKKLRRPLHLDCVKVVLRHVLSALQHVHHLGYVHCDVKLENLLLKAPVDPTTGEAASDVDVLLSDFGFARHVDDVASASNVCGTWAYLAPECLSGGHCGFPRDVWAVGVVAYELLTLRRPFFGDHSKQLIQDFKKYDLKRNAVLQRVTERCPVASDFVARLLAPDPSQRLTAVEALEHPFLAVDSSPSPAPQPIHIDPCASGVDELPAAPAVAAATNAKVPLRQDKELPFPIATQPQSQVEQEQRVVLDLLTLTHTE